MVVVVDLAVTQSLHPYKDDAKIGPLTLVLSAQALSRNRTMILWIVLVTNYQALRVEIHARVD
jgi:hypothetical protein